ncbi:Tcp10b [Phodopus roborovskii]|uniref:Tcp10b protein n=1 Tax=Phodopus roborovskii TaxID=109678 RepID=A0AAV0A780_PHORO|nr:Tcp10b [Phodopus roborovskii]
MLKDLSQGAGANHEKKMDATAQGPGEGRKPEEGLQKQICDLAAELTRQASWWCAAHKNLQSQIDILMKENQDLREELQALKHQGVEATKSPPATPPTAEAANTLPVYIKIEGTDSDKTTSWDERDDAPSVSFRNGSTMATGGTDSLDERMSFMSFDEKVMHLSSNCVQRHLGRISPELPSDTTVLDTESVADVWSSNPDSSEGELLMHTQGSRLHPSFSENALWLQNLLARSGPTREALHSMDEKEDETQEKRHPNGKIYYYADAQTTHTTYPDGVEVVQFPNKWTEKFYPDGSKKTVFPDGTVKQLKDGCEETVFPDGTCVTVKRNGDKTIMFSNGQKEIHTARFKRREFPDGTTKTVYCNGCQETKYASGRVRVKDEMGTVILDWK